MSWSYFFNHHKGMLIGHEDNNRDQDEHMTVTLHHNWMQQETRGPRVRFARVHVYNAYYDGMREAVTSHMDARVVVEHSFFYDVDLATKYNSSKYGSYDDDNQGLGELVQRDNVFVQVDDDDINAYGDAFDPAELYDYEVDDAILVPGLVMAYAGAGKKYTDRWRHLV